MFLFLLTGRILQRKGYKGTRVCSFFRACQRNVSFFDPPSSLHMEIERSESAPSIEKHRTMDSVGSWTNGQGRARRVILQRSVIGRYIMTVQVNQNSIQEGSERVALERRFEDIG